MPTLSRKSPAQEPDPDHSNEWVAFIKWCLSDHGRAAWVLVFVVVILGAVVTTAAFLAHYVGDIGGLVGGGLVGGGITYGAGAIAKRRRRDQDSADEA
jgi:hypothetical protein